MLELMPILERGSHWIIRELTNVPFSCFCVNLKTNEFQAWFIYNLFDLWQRQHLPKGYNLCLAQNVGDDSQMILRQAASACLRIACERAESKKGSAKL